MKTLPILLASLLAALPAGVRAASSDYVPVNVIKTTSIIFPKDASQLGVRDGEVHIFVQVDETGKLTDYLVTSYTVRQFADRVVNAVKAWRYEPARLDGKPISTVTELGFEFNTKGLVVTELNLSSFVAQRDYLLHPETYTYRARTLHELDRIPAPSKIVHPVFPPEAAPKHGSLSIDVQFYIDEEGQVRMPSVSRQANEANETLAAAAINAVSQWRFEPPTSHGESVLVSAVQEFKFQPAVAKK